MTFQLNTLAYYKKKQNQIKKIWRCANNQHPTDRLKKICVDKFNTKKTPTENCFLLLKLKMLNLPLVLKSR